MAEAAAFWRTRHETFAGNWLQHYWGTWVAPHRVRLLRAIEAQGPIETIHEVGCGPGANLRLWRHYHPEWRLSGQDVNAAATAWCREQLGPSVDAQTADFREAASFPVADVVVSCYALAYADPARLGPILARCWGAARVALVLAEPMVAPGAPAGPCAPDREEWRHDYSALLAAFGAVRWTTWPLDPPADRLNNFLIARKDTPTPCTT